jgi:hypothetical protein
LTTFSGTFAVVNDEVSLSLQPACLAGQALG